MRRTAGAAFAALVIVVVVLVISHSKDEFTQLDDLPWDPVSAIEIEQGYIAHRSRFDARQSEPVLLRSDHGKRWESVSSDLDNLDVMALGRMELGVIALVESEGTDTAIAYVLASDDGRRWEQVGELPAKISTPVVFGPRHIAALARCFIPQCVEEVHLFDFEAESVHSVPLPFPQGENWRHQFAPAGDGFVISSVQVSTTGLPAGRRTARWSQAAEFTDVSEVSLGRVAMHSLANGGVLANDGEVVRVAFPPDFAWSEIFTAPAERDPFEAGWIEVHPTGAAAVFRQQNTPHSWAARRDGNWQLIDGLAFGDGDSRVQVLAVDESSIVVHYVPHELFAVHVD